MLLFTVDVLDAGLIEGSVAEGLSDSVDVLVLEHESLVDIEVAESEFVEGGKSFFEGLVSLLSNFLVVGHLGSLDSIGNSNLALHKFARWARFVSWSFVLHLFILDSNNWLLSNHLDGCSLFLWLNNKDVAPDLVAKLDVSGLHSEVGRVASLFLWSLALDGNLTHSVSFDLIVERNWNRSDIVTSGLEELYISWPGCLTVISEDPGLSEFYTSLNFMFVVDALLHKASLISWVLGLWSGGLFLNWLVLLDEADFCWEILVHLDFLVLADEFGWSKFWLSDLEHRVTSVDSVALTVLAKVVIVVN